LHTRVLEKEEKKEKKRLVIFTTEDIQTKNKIKINRY